MNKILLSLLTILALTGNYAHAWQIQNTYPYQVQLRIYKGRTGTVNSVPFTGPINPGQTVDVANAKGVGIYDMNGNSLSYQMSPAQIAALAQ